MQSDPQQTRREIVLAHLDLADSIARRHAIRASDLDDLRQVACIGLMKACERFDPERGDFVAFAVPTISGEVKRHLRDNGWMLRPPRSIQELRSRINAVSPALAQELGRTPTAADVAARLGEDRARVAEAMSARHGRNLDSLDAPVGDDEALTLADTVAAVDFEFERAEFAATLAPALRALSPRDKQIVYLRFVLEQTQQEIAAQLGVTQMQVSRLLRKLLANLRSAVSESALTGEAGCASPRPDEQPLRASRSRTASIA
jgi:RNA polymerase sigma-B factor